jgi:hypothetical protein
MYYSPEFVWRDKKITEILSQDGLLPVQNFKAKIFVL